MTDAAVKLFELLYQSRPEAVVGVAGLLAADGRSDEAFAQIEKHARKLPPRVKAMAGIAAIRSGGTTPERLALVKGWLATAKAEEPASVAVLLEEGQLCSFSRDKGGSEAAFEAAVTKDPTNVVALNNLAWTLSADPDAGARVKDLLDRATREVGLTAGLLDTRARMRMAARQYDAAEQDLKHALALEKTPLRLFHMALVNRERTPAKPAEVTKWFDQAVEMGLDERMVHMADVEKYRAMSAR
jgi:tetratricopeptide (TPR) repeat protein